jgi:hypothetical protein
VQETAAGLGPVHLTRKDSFGAGCREVLQALAWRAGSRPAAVYAAAAGMDHSASVLTVRAGSEGGPQPLATVAR